MINEKLLEQIIKESGLKKGFIAESLGMTRWGLLNKLTNQTEFKASEIAALQDLLRLDNETRDQIFFNEQGV